MLKTDYCKLNLTGNIDYHHQYVDQITPDHNTQWAGILFNFTSFFQKLTQFKTCKERIDCKYIRQDQAIFLLNIGQHLWYVVDYHIK